MLNTHAQYLVGIRFKQKQGVPCFRRSKKASEEKKEHRVQPRTKQAQHLPIRHAGRPADFMVTQCHRQDPTGRFWFQHEFWKHAQGTNASSHVSVKKEASRMQSSFARVGMHGSQFSHRLRPCASPCTFQAEDSAVGSAKARHFFLCQSKQVCLLLLIPFSQ